MKRSLRDRGLRALSILFVATPFGFALIRAARTGYDTRYFWVALASLLGAVAAIAAGGQTLSRRPPAVVALSAAAFVTATLLAVFAAWLLGTRVGPGSLVVGAAFGFCCAAGTLLYALARSGAA